MTASKRYVLDSNVFIEAKNKYYSFSICPGFWTSLNRLSKLERICSIDRVRKELMQPKSSGDRPPDLLSDWAEATTQDAMFKGTQDTRVITEYQRLLNWALGRTQFSNKAKEEFAKVADAWLVAYASVNKLVVVTHEEFARDAGKTIPIPNVCLEFDVPYVNSFEMLDELKVSFELKHGSIKG